MGYHDFVNRQTRETGIHAVKKRLVSGEVRTYYYAWRGGPALKSAPHTPAFFEEYRRAAFARKPSKRIASPDHVVGRSTRVAVTRQLLRNAVARSGRRGMKCGLTADSIYALLDDQKHVCAVSGIPFDYLANAEGEYSRNPFGPSLDRIDSRKGYTPDNVRIVLSAVNYGINEWGLDNYLKICRAVAERSPSPTTGR